jgi:hypothetical protein
MSSATWTRVVRRARLPYNLNRQSVYPTVLAAEAGEFDAVE